MFFSWVVKLFEACDKIVHFWGRAPALLYGFSLLLGAGIAFGHVLELLFPLIFLWVTFLLSNKRLSLRFILSIALFFLIQVYILNLYHFPINQESKAVAGHAQFHISSVKEKSSHFGKAWQYQVWLTSFIPQGSTESIAHNLPCKLTLPQKTCSVRPIANVDYQLNTSLYRTIQDNYALKFDKEAAWYPLKETWSLAEWRFTVKKALSKHLNEVTEDSHASSFLSGIATGEFADTLLSFELSRFGLQHIMAISGFHFAVFVGLLNISLRFFLPCKLNSVILMLLLTGYFFFLGYTPSIFRAWTSAMLVLGGQLLERRPQPLNSLGIALMAVIIIDPLVSKGIGCQLSFAATLAILLLFRPLNLLLQRVFSKRSLGEVIEMDLLNQHAYVLLSFFREALALTLAVHLVAIPLMLFYFFKFPYLSIIYNLFFPFLIGISMFLLVLALFFTFLIPSLSILLHQLNNAYTQFVLNIVLHTPTSIDFCLRTESLHRGLLIVYLTLLFALAVIVNIKLNDSEDNSLFTYI